MGLVHVTMPGAAEAMSPATSALATMSYISIARSQIGCSTGHGSPTEGAGGSGVPSAGMVGTVVVVLVRDAEAVSLGSAAGAVAVSSPSRLAVHAATVNAKTIALAAISCRRLVRTNIRQLWHFVGAPDTVHWS